MVADGRAQETVLVVGATGMLGRPVAGRLSADGYRVRALTREPERARSVLGEGIEYARGDVDDAAALDRALEGCKAVHISLKAGPQPGEPERVEHQGAARIAVAAARAGLERITYLSGCYVAPEQAAESEAEAAKLGAERAIEESGVPFTIFKPTYFMETLPLHVQGPFGVVLGRQPHPLHMVAAGDYAGMVSRALRTPESVGRRLYVFGPEPLTIAEALRLYCRVVEGRQACRHRAAPRDEGDQPPLHGRGDDPGAPPDGSHATPR
ncbi:MAG TPA: NAD(P)H-binding protein [Thermoleophilaceae bacterium]|nr:NAD(P)H-binding protein [Thermoleophilaceae bacterium]